MSLNEVRVILANRRLLATLVARELAARNAGSALGLLWIYLQPLALLLAYFLLFDKVLGVRLGEGAATERLGQYLVVGMVPWLLFSESLSRGSGALVEAGGLLQKNALPLSLFPARATVAVALIFMPFFALGLVWAVVRHGPSTALLAGPLLFGLQWLVGFTLAYLFALLIAAMRDVQQLMTFCLSIGLFLSPVLYPPDFLPESFRWVLWVNPATPFVLAWQSVVLSGGWPEPVLWAVMLAWFFFAVGLLGLFLRRAREQVVDWL